MVEDKQTITLEELKYYIKDKKADKEILNGQLNKARNQIDLMVESLSKLEQEIANMEKTFEEAEQNKKDL